MVGRILKLEELNNALENKSSHLANEATVNIANFFDFHLTQAELDLAIKTLFNKTQGTVAFLKRTMGQKTLFQESNVNILTLWHNLIVKYNEMTKFRPYASGMTKCCLQLMTSKVSISAKERERATMVVQVVVRNRLLTSSDVLDMLDRVLRIFMIKKPQEIFIYEVFKLIATIIDKYEQTATPLASDIMRHCLHVLQDTSESQQIGYRALTGAIECLAVYLARFPPMRGTDDTNVSKIYNYIKRLSNLPDDIRHKNTFRTAIDLFIEQSVHFRKQIYLDYKYWRDCLEKWLQSNVYEDMRRGVSGFHAFYDTLSRKMIKDEKVDKEAIKLFLLGFKNTLESPKINLQRNRVAIDGFGAMATLCQKYFPDMINDMVSLIIQRCELVHMADDNAMRDLLDHLPYYIQALARVAREMENAQITDAIVETLRKILIRLIRDFQYLPTSKCDDVVRSICLSLYSIYTTDVTIFERLLTNVIFEGVILTCSHKHVFDANDDWADNIDWKDNITFKSYSILWYALLDEHISTMPFESAEVTARIIDQLILVLYQILDKLDLRMKKRVYTAEDGRVQELYFCDPNFDLCPERPKDFHIFINLVDFYRDIWPKFATKFCVTWIEQYCEEMIKLALRYPLISGFLKLLGVGLDTAEQLNIFTKQLTPDFEATLSHALKVMIVRCQRVSGELLISTLELVLKYPLRFLNQYIPEIIPIFETALDLGKSMSWLVELAIHCLERISDRAHGEEIKVLHSRILPLFDSYLQGHCTVEQLSVRETRDGNKLQKKRRVKQTQLESHEIQAKIIALLGKLPSKAAAVLVMNSTNAQNLVKWDSQKLVQLSLRLPDISTVIYLDALVPRMCDLALTSTDRQTKIAACEVVHALVLYMIGARAHEGQTWAELCKRMLILGCDGDATVQQMFEPLLMQVMHFMSKYENLDKGVEEIMNALMDGISSKSNFGLRDLSASCLREFVEWSIKQTTPQQLEASKVSLETILGRLKMNSFDSDASKRIGAALAFNNLYRILREEESVCDIFFMDLLHTFCVNFKLSEELTALPPNDDMNSDLEMISEALDHVVRVLAERSYLYEKESNRRVVPNALGSGRLVDALLFLITESGSRKIFYRRKCMKLAQILAPRVRGFTGLQSAFEKGSINNEQLRNICEGTWDGCGIRGRPNLNFFMHSSFEFPDKVLYGWMENLLGSLECYTWLLREKLIVAGRGFFADTNVLQVIAYYLKQICWKPTSEILHNEVCGESEVTENIKILKGLIAIQIVDFLIEFFSSDCAIESGVGFWEPNTNQLLRKLIVQLIFEPETLHLDFRLDRVLVQLDKRVNRLCEELRDKCPYGNFFIELNQDVVDSLMNNFQQVYQNLLRSLKSRGIITPKLAYTKGILHVLKTPELFKISFNHQQTLIALSKDVMLTLSEGLTRESFGCTVIVKLSNHIKSMMCSLLTIAIQIQDFSHEIVFSMLDGTLLKTADLEANVKRGPLYFEVFRNIICKHASINLFAKCFDLLPGTVNKEMQCHLLKVITFMLEYKRKQYSSSDPDFRNIIDLCIQYLRSLISVFANEETDFHFTEYLSTLALITSSDAISINDRVPELGVWIIKKLQSPLIGLDKKCKIISLLPIIVGAKDYENSQLMSALEDLQRQHFPLRSTEFLKNSLEETSLKFVFITLLNTLITSRSYIVLEFLFKCTAFDEEHLLEDTIRKEVKAYAISLDAAQQTDVLRRTFAIILNDVYEPSIRLTIHRRFLLTIFLNCHEETLMNFFAAEVKQINALTESNYRTNTSARAIEQALVNRIIGYGLIEHFFGIIPKELYWSTSCPIAIALLGQPKADSELVGTFTKKAFYVRTELFPTDNKDAAELFRRYQCAAYTALCSLVSNTQRELMFYSKFLFEEITRKNEIIWSRLIDCSIGKNYIFPGQETEEHAKFKKRFVAIRQLDIRPNVPLKKISSSRRLQTQVIMESSLSQDVGLVDMTAYSVRTHSEALRRRESNRSSEFLPVRLESHDLNKHEVMPMLCGIIKFMHDNQITPVIRDLRLRRSYPWVQAIADNIGGCENHPNVRVFLAQVVANCSEVFRQFAHVLFRPILRMLVDECAGSHLNFFITDMVTLLIKWTSEEHYTPQAADEIVLVQDLLKFMMKNAWTDRKEILKYNLEIVQTMLTIWRSIIKIPSNLLLDLLTRSHHKQSTDNEGGVVFLGMILSNNLTPWTELNRDLYIEAILTNVDNESASIYQPAAYTLGLAIASLSESGDKSSAERLIAEAQTRLHNHRNRRDRKSEQLFIDLLYNMSKGSPHIIDSEREFICFRIPSENGAPKRSYLEMVLSRIEAFEKEHVHSTIIGIGIKDLLKHPHFQLLALHIVNRSLPMLEPDAIDTFFQDIEECLLLHESDCRDIAYEVFIYIAQNHTDELRDKAVKVLLKGVNDPDPEIQKRIYQFWSKEANMSTRIIDRLIHVLQKYATEVEQHFLGLCTQLLLDPAIESPESKKQIFAFENEHEAKLHEYPINTKQRSRTTYTLPPLFAESQQTQPGIFKATQMCSFVRNTNTDYVFEPTQDPRTMSQTRDSFTLQSQSSMPFEIPTQVLNRRSEVISSEQSSSTAPRLESRRFVKDTEKEKRDKVLRVINVRQRNAQQQAEKSKQNKVDLYRRYRYGEYPDLLINNLAFLLPLQALARRDPLVAKQLFVSILTAILENDKSSSVEFLQHINAVFQLILRNSSSNESTTFSALLEVSLLRPDGFHLPPVEVAKVAKATKNLTIGALYLESYLNENPNTQHWLHLADLYSALREYEVASAIFADKIQTDPRLAKAIEVRTNGRPDQALTLLREVIERNVHAEHYYAYNCYYECLMELGNWTNVYEAIDEEVDIYETLWTDSYNKNFLLPKLLHARIQLLFEDESEDDFLEHFWGWMAIPSREEYMKNEFCEELMMTWIAHKDYHQCHVLYEEYLKKFLRDWSTTNTLYAKTKLDSLLRIQRVAEYDDYAEQFLNNFNDASIRRVLKRWDACVIESTDSLLLWNSLVSYRRYIARKAAIYHPEAEKSLNTSIYYMTLQLFNLAEHQGNFAFAHHIYDYIIPNESDASQKLIKELYTIKNNMLEMKLAPDWLGSLEKSWRATTNLFGHDGVIYDSDKKVLLLRLKAIQATDTLKRIKREPLDVSAEHTLRGLINSTKPDLNQELFDIALSTMMERANLAMSSSSTSTKDIIDSLTTLSLFSYDALIRDAMNNTLLERVFLLSVLQGMKYGSREARQLFPCVLQLPSLENGDLRDAFQKFAAEVPVWMYIAWIPQILSHQKLMAPSFLDPIVESIASKHLEALRYPFLLWYKQALLQLQLSHNNFYEHTNREMIASILAKVQHKLCDKFIKSFKYLAVPEAYLLVQLKTFNQDIRNHSHITHSQFSNLIATLLKDTFNDDENLQGVAYRRLLEYKTDLEAMASLSITDQREEIYKILERIEQRLQHRFETIGSTLRLDTICPWLANYQWCGEEEHIELPGQYTQTNLESAPKARNHIKIVRFDSKVRVLVSQRYPLRISIHGSNGRNYDYLVKHGEDLKQDQRIQQILQLMSQKLNEDKNCQSQNLFIRTYQVIPIERNCGILSWVGNTVSLNDFIFDCFKRHMPDNLHLFKQARAAYLEFIGRPSHARPNTSKMIIYGTAVNKYTNEQLKQNLQTIENLIDSGILRQALMDLALSPQSFFSLRHNFATSLAAMNIAHWVLGVGDRHLQNTLISVKDGSVTGIDFEFTFGSGTMDQNVPEMAPFRLTSHLVNVMSPMGSSGLISKCMVHGLNVFRKADRILLACMEVFIREPSVNWLDVARRNMNQVDERPLLGWEPRHRIDIARCKLQGHNPMYLYERKLHAGLIARKPEFLAGYLRVLRGDVQLNERARLPREGLSAEEQVRCLIDQATDKAVLGISYVGFMPWI